MGNLIVADGLKLTLPDPKSPSAELFGKVAERVPAMIPGAVEKARILTTCMVELNTLPTDCHAGSAVVAAMNCAILGLCPGSALGHAYFVPFWEDKKSGNPIRKVQLVVGYRGFCELGFAARWLRGVTPEVVLRGEKFRRFNSMDGPQMEHELDFELRATMDSEGLGQIQLAYALWSSLDNHRDVTIVSGGKIKSIAARQGNVWKTEPIAMALKTPVRRASKYWKQTRELADAVELDESAERMAPQKNLALAYGYVEPRTEPAVSIETLAPQANEREAEIRARVAEIITPLLPEKPPMDRETQETISAAARRIVNEHCQTMPETDLVYFIVDEMLAARKCSGLLPF